MKAEIEVLGHAYSWKVCVFCKVLASYNQKLNETQFHEIIYSAHKAGLLKPINFKEPTYGYFVRREDFDNFDFEYNRNDLIDLAIQNKWKLPKKMQHKKFSSDSESKTKDLTQNKQEKWSKNGEIAEMNAEKALAIMAWLLSRSISKYKISNKPNISQISLDTIEQAKKYFGVDNVRFEAFHKKLGRALRLLEQEQEQTEK